MAFGMDLFFLMYENVTYTVLPVGFKGLYGIYKKKIGVTGSAEVLLGKTQLAPTYSVLNIIYMESCPS